jgi:putative inorganic carbon (hco3(-)) transporter
MLSRARALPRTYAEPPLPLFGLFLAYVLYIYLQVGYRVPALGDLRLELVLGAILGPVALMRYFSSPVAGGGSVFGWAIALLLAMGIMVPLSQFPGESWNVFLNRGLKFAVYGLCIAAFVTSPRLLRWFIGAFLLAFFKMGQEGFFGTLDGSMIWQEQEIPRLRGPTPSYNHPNSFSGTQLGTLPFLFYLFPLLPWYWRALIGVQALFCGNVILRTGSRTGYLGLLMGIATVIWQAKSRVKAVTIVVFVGLIAIPLVPHDYTDRFTSIFTDKSTAGQDTSVGQRKEILVDATKIFLDHPFGIGVGAFPLMRQKVFGRTQDTHNLYLEIATNIGVQGFIVFTVFVLVLLVTLRSLQKRLSHQITKVQGRSHGSEESEENEEITQHLADLKFVLACARAALVFLMIRLALGGFGMDLYEIYWWFLAGLTVAMIRMEAVAAEKTKHLLGLVSSPNPRVVPARAVPSVGRAAGRA